MQKTRNQKGFADILSLVALAFLLISTLVGTAVVTNNGFNFDIREKAAPPQGEEACEAAGCPWVWRNGECKKTESKCDTSTSTSSAVETCLFNDGGRCIVGETCASQNLVNGSGTCNKAGAICCYSGREQPKTPGDPNSGEPGTGGLADGATCSSNSECQSGNCQAAPGGKYCIASSQNISVKIAEGVTCGTTAYNRECQTGLVCKGNKCQKPESTTTNTITLDDYSKCLEGGNTPSECGGILQNIGQEKTEVQCSQGQVECSNNSLRSCTSSGTWSVIGCSYGCSNNRCNPTPQTATEEQKTTDIVTQSDYLKCLAGGNTPSECSGILQSIGQPIAQSQCSPGKVECSGNLLRSCSTSGTWIVTGCSSGCEQTSTGSKCKDIPVSESSSGYASVSPLTGETYLVNPEGKDQGASCSNDSECKSGNCNGYYNSFGQTIFLSENKCVPPDQVQHESNVAANKADIKLAPLITSAALLVPAIPATILPTLNAASIAGYSQATAAITTTLSSAPTWFLPVTQAVGGIGGVYGLYDQTKDCGYQASWNCAFAFAGIQQGLLDDVAYAFDATITRANSSLGRLATNQIDNILDFNSSQYKTLNDIYDWDYFNSSYSQLVEQTTGYSLAEAGPLSEYLSEYHLATKARYGLPSIDMKYENPLEYTARLREIAIREGITIKPYTEYAQFFAENPAGGVYVHELNSIVVEPSTAYDPIRNLIEDASTFEHELIHGLQKRYYPGMPTEIRELEAYFTANVNPVRIIENPDLIDTIFGGVNFSSSFWYKNAGLARPWELLP